MECQAEIEATGAAATAVVTIVVEGVVEAEEETVRGFEASEVEDEVEGLRWRFSRQSSS